VDRLTTLHAAAQAAGRELVVSARTAYLLASIAPRWTSGSLPRADAGKGLVVYARKKLRFYDWEKPFHEAGLSASDVRARGSKYLLALDFMHFTELIDLRPPAGTPFIHSMSEPFTEDDVDDQVMHNWLDHFGMTFHQMHASGHASEGELFEIIRGVKSRIVYPIHTEHPEAFQKLGSYVRPPELGATYPVSPPR
jgi:mRNA degradation ribonuclease J1/J2